MSPEEMVQLAHESVAKGDQESYCNKCGFIGKTADPRRLHPNCPYSASEIGRNERLLAEEVIRLNEQIASLDMTMEGYESLELKAEVARLSAALEEIDGLRVLLNAAASGVKAEHERAEAALTRGWWLGKEAAVKAECLWCRDPLLKRAGDGGHLSSTGMRYQCYAFKIRALPDDPPQEASR